MQNLLAIVVPFCKGINVGASTSSKIYKKGRFSLDFRVFSVMRESEATFSRREKISYFCEVTTCFGRSVAIS